MKIAREALKREEEIRARVVELGVEISRDYAGREVCVLGVMQGALTFMTDLVRSIEAPVRCGRVDMRASIRPDAVTEIAFTSSLDVTDRDLLLVEDVLDTGITTAYLREQLALRRPRSLRVCTLLDKPQLRKIDLVPDYRGFEVPDSFVVGYGLGYEGRYQNLPYLATLEREPEGGAAA